VADADGEADFPPAAGEADPLAAAAGVPAPGRPAEPDGAAVPVPATLVGAVAAPADGVATPDSDDAGSGEAVSATPGSAAAGVESLAAWRRAARSLFDVLVPQPVAMSVTPSSSGRNVRRRTRI
jgi:hypothetical protein